MALLQQCQRLLDNFLPIRKRRVSEGFESLHSLFWESLQIGVGDAAASDNRLVGDGGDGVDGFDGHAVDPRSKKRLRALLQID